MRRLLVMAIVAIATAFALTGCAVVQPPAAHDVPAASSDAAVKSNLRSPERTAELAQLVADAGYVIAGTDSPAGDDAIIGRWIFANGEDALPAVWTEGKEGWGIISITYFVQDNSCERNAQAFVWIGPDGVPDLVHHARKGVVVSANCQAAAIQLTGGQYVTSFGAGDGPIEYSCLPSMGKCPVERDEQGEVVTSPLDGDVNIDRLDNRAVDAINTGMALVYDDPDWRELAPKG